jgi:hypothetical protein
MATKNNITGDEIKSKPLSAQGRKNWDLIFSKEKPDTNENNDSLSREDESLNNSSEL